jgi:16S rRNA U1498 N3-methylase RsmE
VFVLLAFVASGSAVYAWQQLKTNEAFLDATLMRATEIVNEAVVQAKRYNVPRTATIEARPAKLREAQDSPK